MSCGSGCGVPRVVTLSTGGGPAKKYDCIFNVATSAFTGAFGTASAIGWESNDQGVVTCLGGTFFVQDGINKNFGFGIYDGDRMTWADADGYLPAQITSFDSSGAEIAITEFADKLVIDSRPMSRCTAESQSTTRPATSSWPIPKRVREWWCSKLLPTL